MKVLSLQEASKSTFFLKYLSIELVKFEPSIMIC